MKFQEGDKINIKGIKYTVRAILPEFDKWNPQKEDGEGWHTRVELHNEEIKTWPTTHILKIYKENNKIILQEIIYNRWEGLPRDKPKNFQYTTYKDLGDIKLSDIKKL